MRQRTTGITKHALVLGDPATVALVHLRHLGMYEIEHKSMPFSTMSPSPAFMSDKSSSLSRFDGVVPACGTARHGPRTNGTLEQ